MTLIELLTVVHISAAIVWLGGSFMLWILFQRSQKSRDEATVVGLASSAEFIGKAVFNPAGIITLAAGIWLVAEIGYSFSETWISIGFLGIILGAGLGIAFYPRALRRVKEGIEAEGLTGNDTLAALRTLRVVSTLEWILLLVVVWAMVVKPGA